MNVPSLQHPRGNDNVFGLGQHPSLPSKFFVLAITLLFLFVKKIFCLAEWSSAVKSFQNLVADRSHSVFSFENLVADRSYSVFSFENHVTDCSATVFSRLLGLADRSATYFQKLLAIAQCSTKR